MKKVMSILTVLIMAICFFSVNALATSCPEPDPADNIALGVGIGIGIAEAQAKAAAAAAAKSKAVNSTTLNEQKEKTLNSHIPAMGALDLNTPAPVSPAREDHRVQTEIIDFLLAGPGEHWFKITAPANLWTVDNAESKSRALGRNLPAQTRVMVIENIAELQSLIYLPVGIVDAYSDSGETMYDCFVQGLVDTGKVGGNVFLMLKKDYSNGATSTTKGFGTTGTYGFLSGAKDAGTFGSAFGYAKNRGMAVTFPYVHGIALYVEGLNITPN